MATFETVFYENLANAIVKQAAVEYVRAYKTLKRNPKSKWAQKRMAELLEFFHSGWFEMLTSLDADSLLQKLEARC